MILRNLVLVTLAVLGNSSHASARLRYEVPPDTVAERLARAVHRSGQHIIYPRILIMCAKGELFMMAGIVNSPENVEFMTATHVRSYILIDEYRDFEAGPGGARGEDSVIWLERNVSAAQAERLLRATRLEI